MLKYCAIVLVLVGSSCAMLGGMMGGMMGGMAGPGGMHTACMSSFLRKDPATPFQGFNSPFKVNFVQKTYSAGSPITVKIESTNPTDKFTDFACAFDLGMMTPIQDGSISRTTANTGKNCMVTVAKKLNNNPVSSANFVWNAPRQFYYEEPLQMRCAVFKDSRTVYEIRSVGILTTNPAPNMPTFKKWKFDEAQRKMNEMMSQMQWGQGNMNPMSMMQNMMNGQSGQGGANPMAAFKMMGQGGQGGGGGEMGGMNMGQMMRNMQQGMQGMQGMQG